MNISTLLQHRQHNQLLDDHSVKNVAALVKWFGAVQSQDYLGAMWAMGSRLNGNITQADIENAIETKAIVRTWPLRGTLHFVAPSDVHWMLEYFTPRIIVRAASNYRKEELDNKVFTKSRKVIEQALQKEKILTRLEMYEALERGKISTTGTRGLFILGWLAQHRVICFGPRKGKQFTFVLLDEWVKKGKQLTQAEAFTELGRRYFISHGPATPQDFCWWSGLNLTEGKSVIHDLGSELQHDVFDNKTYYFVNDFQSKKSTSSVYLLPAYDEYTVAYKDRSAFLDPAHIEKTRNGIFSPVIVINGKIAGAWKRTFVKKSVKVETEALIPLNSVLKSNLKKTISRYESFVGDNSDEL